MIAASISVPPVVPPPRNTNPIPIPCRRPPYNATRRKSSDSFQAGRMASHIVSEISPNSAFLTKAKPFILVARRNNGTFRIRFVIQSGIPFPYKPFVQAFTRIAIPEKPPVTIPAASKQEVIAVPISPVPTIIRRYSRYQGFFPAIFISTPFSVAISLYLNKVSLNLKERDTAICCFPFLVCPI